MSIILHWVVLLKTSQMNELDLEHLLNKIESNQFTVADLNVFKCLTQKTKYEQMIKELMMKKLHKEYQMVTEILN